MRSKLVFIILIAILGLGMGKAPQVDSKMVDFSLSDLNNQEVKLSDLKGKVVFLNFWATWCPPCRKEMPSMQKLHDRFAKEEFIMLAVSIDRSGIEQVGPFIKKNGYTFPVLLDSTGKVASQYKVKGIPATFIIDKKGKLVERHVGARNWADDSVIKKINKLIKQ